MKINRSVFLFLVMAVLFASVLACTSGTNPPVVPASPEGSAWNACTQFLAKEIGYSISDAEKYNPAGVTDNSDGDHEVVIYYAKYKTKYQCTVYHNPSTGEWEVIEIQPK